MKTIILRKINQWYSTINKNVNEFRSMGEKQSKKAK